MGSKLLTQQEQDTLVDGWMWRLHKGPVIGEASRCKSRSVSVCDMDVCEGKGQLFTACICCGCRTGRKWTVPRKLSKRCKRLEEGEGACISWMIGRTSCSSTSSKRMKSVLGRLSADQSSIRWLATHGKELTMVQKDVLRGWHGTCNVERNWNESEQNETNRRNARKFRSNFRHSVVPGGDSSKVVSYSP